MSFKNTLRATREKLREGNRENLARAYLHVEERITDLQEQIVKFRALKDEIETAGDESTWIDQSSATKIFDLYNKAKQEWLN